MLLLGLMFTINLIRGWSAQSRMNLRRRSTPALRLGRAKGSKTSTSETRRVSWICQSSPSPRYPRSGFALYYQIVRTPKGLLGQLAGALLLPWLTWYRRTKADQELDADRPEWALRDQRTYQLRGIAVRIAEHISDDGEAVSAIKAGGGNQKDWKRAAALILADGHDREHREYVRAARLLRAAADDGPPVTASSEDEALFQAVERLEALPVASAFAVLAAEAPALRELEQQVITSSSTPARQGSTADDRVDEILDDLAQVVGPQAPAGSPLIRSQTAFGYGRAYLLGKAGLLISDFDTRSEGVPPQEADMLGLLARGYGVAPDLLRVATAISKQVVDRPGVRERYATATVLSLLLREPDIAARLRRGERLSDSSREPMTAIVDINLPHLSSAEFVDELLEEVRSKILQTP
jgi:hypothetical protein